LLLLAAGRAGRRLAADKLKSLNQHTWPRTLAQEPIHVSDRDYDPLHPYAFGLRTK
jgi:hypothetical protein